MVKNKKHKNKKTTEGPLVQTSKIPKYYWRSLFPSPKRHLTVDCQAHRLVTGRMEVLLFRDLFSLMSVHDHRSNSWKSLYNNSLR